MRKYAFFVLIALAVIAARPLLCFTVKDFKIKQVKCHSTEFDAVDPGEPIEEPTEYVIPTEPWIEPTEEPTLFPTDWYWPSPTMEPYPGPVITPNPYPTEEP